ncbi:MAG: AbrB/MazE/SpoVT family DNA-binding domain-containing protein [Chromatiaceae bacterium]
MNLVEKMRISPDGQITIPESIREKAGLLPDCDVEFHVENGRAWLAARQLDRARHRASIHATIERVAGSANANLDLSTDDILAMTRGE